MRATQDTTIDGMRFRVTQLPGMRGYLLSNDLLQLIAPALGHASKLRPGVKVLDMGLDELGPMLAAVLPGLSREKQETLTRELLEGATVTFNGQNVPVLDVFDTAFQGKVLAAYKLMAFALKVNFGSFSAALGSVGTGRLTPTPPPSETSDTSAGPPSA